MLILLAFLAILIFIQFFRIVGKKEYQNVLIKNPYETIKANINPGKFPILKEYNLSYEKIIEELNDFFIKVHLAFESASIDEIKDYISNSVYKSLKKEMEKRVGYKMQITFPKKTSCKLKNVKIKDNECTVDAEFKSNQIVVISDKEGNIVDNPHRISEDIVNYWIFSKNLSNLNNPWILIKMC